MRRRRRGLENFVTPHTYTTNRQIQDKVKTENTLWHSAPPRPSAAGGLVQLIIYESSIGNLWSTYGWLYASLVWLLSLPWQMCQMYMDIYFSSLFVCETLCFLIFFLSIYIQGYGDEGMDGRMRLNWPLAALLPWLVVLKCQQHIINSIFRAT